MISTGDLKKGITIELDDKLYAILDYSHIKTGRGSAQVRIKLRDVRSGTIIERTYQAGAKFPRARVERRDMQFLYADDQFFNFMNTETYDQVQVEVTKVDDAKDFLRENDSCELILYGDEVLGLQLPGSVVLTVTISDPGLRGDTATGATKPATLETGLVVNVPLFIEAGEKIRVNTDTREYIERAT